MAERQRDAVVDMLSGGPGATAGFPTVTDAQTGVAHLTKIGLSLITYLVSDGADITRRHTGRNRSRRATDNRSPAGDVHLYRVGATVGPQLAHLSRDSSSSGTHTAGQRTVAPHVRRAHLHTFRRGPGRTERFIKWLPPTLVNAHKGPPATTVHPVAAPPTGT